LAPPPTPATPLPARVEEEVEEGEGFEGLQKQVKELRRQSMRRAARLSFGGNLDAVDEDMEGQWASGLEPIASQRDAEMEAEEEEEEEERVEEADGASRVNEQATDVISHPEREQQEQYQSPPTRPTFGLNIPPKTPSFVGIREMMHVPTYPKTPNFHGMRNMFTLPRTNEQTPAMDGVAWEMFRTPKGFGAMDAEEMPESPIPLPPPAKKSAKTKKAAGLEFQEEAMATSIPSKARRLLSQPASTSREELPEPSNQSRARVRTRTRSSNTTDTVSELSEAEEKAGNKRGRKATKTPDVPSIVPEDEEVSISTAAARTSPIETEQNEEHVDTTTEAKKGSRAKVRPASTSHAKVSEPTASAIPKPAAKRSRTKKDIASNTANELIPQQPTNARRRGVTKATNEIVVEEALQAGEDSEDDPMDTILLDEVIPSPIKPKAALAKTKPAPKARAKKTSVEVVAEEENLGSAPRGKRQAKAKEVAPTIPIPEDDNKENARKEEDSKIPVRKTVRGAASAAAKVEVVAQPGAVGRALRARTRK
jgi:hypothetical protein